MQCTLYMIVLQMYHLQVPLGKLEVEKFQGGGGVEIFFGRGCDFFRDGVKFFWGEVRFFREGLRFFFGGVRHFREAEKL